VFSLVLCSVPSPLTALRNAHRVLRLGGQPRFYEHVRAESWRVGQIQDRTDWVWSHIAGGCHANRDTVAVIVDDGFCVA
jgi:hypothetical protein